MYVFVVKCSAVCSVCRKYTPSLCLAVYAVTTIKFGFHGRMLTEQTAHFHAAGIV